MPKLGLLIPTIWGSEVPKTEDLLDFCRRADALGFDSLWVISKLFHRNHLAHPMTMLAYAAAVTQRIGLGTAVDLLNIRHPVEMAQQAATLNALSGERLTLGISQGGRDSDYAAKGVPISQRTGRLVEGMRVMRRLWSESDVTFEGKYYTLDQANISPKPQRPGGIPLLLGSTAEASLKRAGRIADGWVQGGRGTPESFATRWKTVTQAAEEAGRDPSKLTNGKLLYTNPGPNRAQAEEELERNLATYYGPGYPMDQTACGTPAEIADRITSFGEAGCDLLMLGLPGPDLAKLEILAAEVMPLTA